MNEALKRALNTPPVKRQNPPVPANGKKAVNKSKPSD